MFTRNPSTANRDAVLPATPSSIQCRTVSVMYVFFITTVMPRAATITRAAPRKSDAPETIVFTVSSSPKREMTPMITARR